MMHEEFTQPLNNFKELEERVLNHWDSVNTWRLIDNDLDHILFELERSNTYYVRVGKDCHQLFYRLMISILRGSDGYYILNGSFLGKKDRRCYKTSKEPWMCVEKSGVITGCTRAWRYTEPSPCDPPPTEASEHKTRNEENNLWKSGVINFITALARLQSPCFMGHLGGTRPITVTDYEMGVIERLHLLLRNELEHFEPKISLMKKTGTMKASLICLKKSQEVLGMCVISEKELREKIRSKIKHAEKLLQAAIEKIGSNNT